jgi:hypothetical protein
MRCHLPRWFVVNVVALVAFFCAEMNSIIEITHMRDYRLFIYDEDCQVIGPGEVISAASDSEAIAQAEAIRGSFAAELLDFDGLRIVKRFATNGKAPSEAAE